MVSFCKELLIETNEASRTNKGIDNREVLLFQSYEKVGGNERSVFSQKVSFF